MPVKMMVGYLACLLDVTCRPGIFFYKLRYDAILLSLMGGSIARRLRRRHEVPTIVVC